MSDFLESLKQAETLQPKKQQHLSIRKTRMQEKYRRKEATERRIYKMVGHCGLGDFSLEKERAMQALAITAMHTFYQQRTQLEQNEETGKHEQPLVYERTTWKNLDD